jgi:hypothetical protein
MHDGAFVDQVQTIGICLMAATLIYVVVRLDRALTQAAKKLKGVLGKQTALQEGIERVWTRVDLIESLQGTRKDFIHPTDLMTMLHELRSRLEQLEKVDERVD